MNKVILMGRLTRNPDIRYSQGEKSTCIARYTLAVNRRYHRDGEAEADFINCVAFGNSLRSKKNKKQKKKKQKEFRQVVIPFVMVLKYIQQMLL